MKKVHFKNKTLVLAVAVVLCVSLTACRTEKSGSVYKIYYANANGNKLVSKNYDTEQMDKVALINELFAQMNTKQKDGDYVVIKPDFIIVDKVEVRDELAIITFGSAYYEMKPSTEVLFRAAVVKGICQIDGISQVKIMVGDNEAVYLDGTIIGVMTADSFADDSDIIIGNVEWRNINLYFANRTGDMLVKNEVSVAYSKNVSLEKIVVQKIIQGPSQTGSYVTLPSDLHLLNVSVNNRTCYVNLSGEFTSEMVNVSAQLPVYSIVNSLCDLETVDNVRIMINGDSTKTFRESINLDTTFTGNYDLVAQ